MFLSPGQLVTLRGISIFARDPVVRRDADSKIMSIVAAGNVMGVPMSPKENNGNLEGQISVLDAATAE